VRGPGAGRIPPNPVVSYLPVGTLSSELGAVLERLPAAPRVYADANVPAGLVAYMRQRLGWDVFFVMEHADLRRARDLEHFRLARQLHRTLVTLDHDYFDDRRFPPAETSGVVVVSAPDERLMARVLRHVDEVLLRPLVAPGIGTESGERVGPLPLSGRKVHAHPDWPRPFPRTP
jgi:predicted nuclease of predicted toxin-antitoxin system